MGNTDTGGRKIRNVGKTGGMQSRSELPQVRLDVSSQEKKSTWRRNLLLSGAVGAMLLCFILLSVVLATRSKEDTGSVPQYVFQRVTEAVPQADAAGGKAGVKGQNQEGADSPGNTQEEVSKGDDSQGTEAGQEPVTAPGRTGKTQTADGNRQDLPGSIFLEDETRAPEGMANATPMAGGSGSAGVSRDAEAVVLANPDAVIDVSNTLYTYEKMEKDLKLLAQAYPRYISVSSGGQTADNRELYIVNFGNRNARRQIFICASTSGREYMTTQLVMKQLEYYCAHYKDGSYDGVSFSEIFDRTSFVIMPMVNPDGVTISQLGENGIRREDMKENLRGIYALDREAGYTTDDYEDYLVQWESNGLGVDLNHNFSPGWETVADRGRASSSLYRGMQPGSEAETSVQMNVVNSMSNPLFAICYQSYGDLIFWQYGQPEPLRTRTEELASDIEELTGHKPADYSNDAGFSNWCVIEKGVPSVTVKVGTVPPPLPLDQLIDLWVRHQYMWAMLATVY